MSNGKKSGILLSSHGNHGLALLDIEKAKDALECNGIMLKLLEN